MRNSIKDVKLVEEVEMVVKKRGLKAGQVAVSWVLAQAKAIDVTVISIPGTSNPERVAENVKNMELSDRRDQCHLEEPRSYR